MTRHKLCPVSLTLILDKITVLLLLLSGGRVDEEYDKGKRKKVRCSQIEFGGPNPFQEIATKKTKLKKVKTDQFSFGNQPFRI
ncbi:hypothetical protein CsSME_00008123 [Camellia sinensis var. sinensis]